MDRISDAILPCSHSFCFVCIEQWKEMGKITCPICKHPIRMDGKDTWVIADQPNENDLHDYLISIAGSFDNS